LFVVLGFVLHTTLIFTGLLVCTAAASPNDVARPWQTLTARPGAYPPRGQRNNSDLNAGLIV